VDIDHLVTRENIDDYSNSRKKRDYLLFRKRRYDRLESLYDSQDDFEK